MKKVIAVLFGLLFTLNIAFADIDVYGDYSSSIGEAVVGGKGYVDVRYYEVEPDVFACGYADGTIVNYGLNLQNSNQQAKAESWLRNLDKSLFSVFNHFGCVRSKI